MSAPESPPPRVYGVIVTYNRVALLERGLAAVAAQTQPCARIVVVDNASTDGTAAFLADYALREPRLTVVTMPCNTGGAGGFHAGVKAAYEQGAEWLWLMDDDCLPHPDALAQLLESAPFRRRHDGQPLGFLASQVRWTDGEICWLNVPQVARFEWNALHPVDPGYTKLLSCSFVSVLISRAAVRRVGYPVKEFFIWYDDVEYTSRICHAGFNAYYVAASVVTHAAGNNAHPTDFAQLHDRDLWKHRYGMRNEVAVIAAQKAGRLRGLGHIARRLYALRASHPSRRALLSLLWAGLRGLFFDYRRCIEYPRGD